MQNLYKVELTLCPDPNINIIPHSYMWVIKLLSLELEICHDIQLYNFKNTKSLENFLNHQYLSFIKKKKKTDIGLIYLSQLTLLLEIFKGMNPSLCCSADQLNFPDTLMVLGELFSKKYCQVGRKLKELLKCGVRELQINKKNKDLQSNCRKRICGCQK